jgi:hypothetical protein
LYAQGVSADDVFLWLPTKPGITLEEPRGWIMGPRLVVPPEYEKRVFRDCDVCNAEAGMLDFFCRDDLDAIVWVFLNHSNSDGLILDHLPMGADWIYRVLRSSRKCKVPKDVLVILDSCFSGKIAKELMGADLAPPRTWIVTASSELSLPCAVVLSQDSSLLNSCTDPSGEVLVEYLIQSSMFMREFFHLICYTEENPALSDLADRLNRRCVDERGFAAECHRNNASRDGLKLRDFFGGPMSPDQLVRIGNEEYQFQVVISPMLPEEFFDDREVGA